MRPNGTVLNQVFSPIYICVVTLFRVIEVVWPQTTTEIPDQVLLFCIPSVTYIEFYFTLDDRITQALKKAESHSETGAFANVQL